MARTDNDTWDLASSVGATATMVAAARAIAMRSDPPLFDDPFAEPLVRAVGVDVFTRLAGGELNPEDLVDVDTDSAGEGMTRMADNMAVRTRFFDDFFVSAARSGVTQAVILAAGLDSRAYRLPWPAGTVVYEIDQPDVIEFKTRTLTGLGAKPTAQLRTVAVDLRDDWPAALRASGFDTTAPTAWIAEGLLVYLPPDAQDRLFDHITALSAPGSRLATEHVPDMSTFSDEHAKRRTERLRQEGLDIDLAELVYHGERSQVIDYLPAQGWAVTTYAVDEMFSAYGFDPPDDEMAARFADVRYVTAELT